MLRRRRPLLRAAAVGGGAYVAGKRRAQRQAEDQQAAAYQDARISQLEQQQAAPPRGTGTGTGQAAKHSRRTRGPIPLRPAQRHQEAARPGHAHRRGVQRRQGEGARHLTAPPPARPPVASRRHGRSRVSTAIQLEASMVESGTSVRNSGSPEPSYFDHVGTEVFEPGQEGCQCCLVGQRPVQHGLDRRRVGTQRLEVTQDLERQHSRHADLVIGRHGGTSDHPSQPPTPHAVAVEPPAAHPWRVNLDVCGYSGTSHPPFTWSSKFNPAEGWVW